MTWQAIENIDGTHDFYDGAVGESMAFTINSIDDNGWTNFTWTGRIVDEDEVEVALFVIDATATIDSHLNLNVTLDRDESAKMTADALHYWGVQGVNGAVEYELGGRISPRANVVE